MKQRFEVFLGELSATSDKLDSMPLITAKYNITKNVYNFLVFANEYKSNSFAFHATDEKAMAEIIPAFDGYLDRLKDFMVTVNACSSVEDIRTALQTFIDSTLVQLLGWITMHNSVLPSACSYNDYFRLRLLNTSNELMTGADCSVLNGILAKVFTAIETSRPYLNIFCRESYYEPSRYGGRTGNSLSNYIASSPSAFRGLDKNYAAKFYLYSQSVESNRELMNNIPGEQFEKSIYGDSGMVRISSMFDIGITGFRKCNNFLSQADNDLRLFKASCNTLLGHIRKNGIAVVLLPEAFLYSSVLYFLCTRLENISFIRDDTAPNMVAVMGIVRNRTVLTLDETCRAMLENMTGDAGYIYTITAQAPEFITFRSSIPNSQDILNDIAKSSVFMQKSLKSVHDKLKLEAVEKTFRPAMPFSPGQLGLILTSGRIDGVVDEGNGCFHLIKGRVVKNPVTTETFEEDGTHVTNTVTGNTTSVTMLTANGLFKTLK